MTGRIALDISETVGRFPGFRVALVVAGGLVIPPARPATLDTFVADVEASTLAALGDRELADVAELKSWREAYKAFGVKKTSYRSSIERLLKSVQRGGGLPRVNALVDLYNAISALHRMPVGADDIDCIWPPLAFRYARPDDSFVALGDASRTADPPKPGEVVYADAEKVLCRRWNWYQDARSAVSPTTTRAVLTVQSLTASGDAVETAASELCRAIGKWCGGHASFRVADASTPVVEVSGD